MRPERLTQRARKLVALAEFERPVRLNEVTKQIGDGFRLTDCRRRRVCNLRKNESALNPQRPLVALKLEQSLLPLSTMQMSRLLGRYCPYVDHAEPVSTSTRSRRRILKKTT